MFNFEFRITSRKCAGTQFATEFTLQSDAVTGQGLVLPCSK
jgi:hypothetical protein